MRRKLSVVFCCAFLLIAGVLAQSDPISGTWTGEFVLERDASNAVQISMELKFDGKSAVSGTFTGLPVPGYVKSGTFDREKQILKLDLAKQGEDTVRLVLEGTVSEGTASGRFTGEETGAFKMKKR
jgi:hypothetical protein